VITRLLRVIPIWGEVLVSFVWGSFMVSDLTLKFFFSLHFLLPWLVLLLVVFHLLFLHKRGRSSSFSDFRHYYKIDFFPEYWGKDGFNLICFLIFLFLSFIFPFSLGDPEIFLESDSMVSPVHIIPE